MQSQSHGLRKFFDTTATKAGLNPLYTEILMGHKIGLTGIYFRPTPADLLEGNDKMLGYVSVIDALTINNEHRLRRQVESLTEKRNEIAGSYSPLDLIYSSEIFKRKCNVQSITSYNNLGCKFESYLSYIPPIIHYVDIRKI